MPKGGWLATLPNVTDRTTINIFTINQQRAGSLVGFDPSINIKVLGSKPISDRVYVNDSIELAKAIYFPAFIPSNVSYLTGVLDTTSTRFYIDYVQVNNSKVVPISLMRFPWYNLTLLTDEQLDDEISAQIEQAMIKVSKLDRNILLSASVGALKTNLFMQLTETMKDVPYGAIYFKKLDHKNKTYSWIYHFGTDARLTSSTNFPSAGVRLLAQQTHLDNAILRSGNPDLGYSKITQGFRIMPQGTFFNCSRNHKDILAIWQSYWWDSVSLRRIFSPSNLCHHHCASEGEQDTRYDENQWGQELGILLFPLHYILYPLCIIITFLSNLWRSSSAIFLHTD
jgi:hypothetical protein